MKRLVLLTFCIYFNSFSAATSQDADGALQAFTQSFLSSPRAQEPDVQAYLADGTMNPGYMAFVCSKESDRSVTAAVAPLIRFLPSTQVVSHKFAYTSIGKHQLFGCLLVGNQAARAADLIEDVRLNWDLRLLGSDHEAFERSGCQHHMYPLHEEDIDKGLSTIAFQTEGQFYSDIIAKKVAAMFFDASANGVQILFSNYHGTVKPIIEHISGTQVFVVDKELNPHLPSCLCKNDCNDPLFSIDFDVQKIMSCFGQASPEDEFSDSE